MVTKEGCLGQIRSFRLTHTDSYIWNRWPTSIYQIALELHSITYNGIGYKTKNMYFLLLFSQFGCVHLFVSPWAVSRQAPLSMGFSRQEYRRGLPFPSPGDLHNPPGIRPDSPTWQADSRTSEAPGKPQGLLLPSMKSSHFRPQMGCKDAFLSKPTLQRQQILFLSWTQPTLSRHSGSIA